MSEKRNDPDFWYWKYMWKSVKQGGLDCCSKLFISNHKVMPDEMKLLEWLIYHVHPFGVKGEVENMPKKLTLDEILRASDGVSDSVNFVPHEVDHRFESDEEF
jgi:hypothetical protein